MGWLTDIFGFDRSNQRYQQQLDMQRRQDAIDAAAKSDREAADLKTANIAKRGQAVDTSRSSANSYLQSLGLNPTDFSGDIDSEINKALSYTADDDPNIGAYLNNLGQSIYGNRETAARSKAGRDINLAFSPDYANSRIGDTADDTVLNSINTEQRGHADEYVNNLMRRGVITQSGQAAANRDLDSQGSRVRTILNELGRSTLDTGRQGLNDIANRGRQTASTLTLGNSFDPSTYTSDADRAYNEFIGGLGDSIKAKAPTDLYDTRGLANIAGAAQGAGNFKFDPGALAGNTQNPADPNEEDNKKRITF